MTMPLGSHDQSHLDALYLHALRMLPSDEIAVVEAQLAACNECRHELGAVQSVVDAFAAWPTDVVRPAPSLWERVAERVGADAAPASAPPASGGTSEPDWTEVAVGISVKILSKDEGRDRVSMLVRLAPHTAYPPHRHADVEELHLLDGELWIEDRLLHPGDYNLGAPGGVDRRVYSETGCTCVLITSSRDTIL